MGSKAKVQKEGSIVGQDIEGRPISKRWELLEGCSHSLMTIYGIKKPESIEIE